MTGFFGKEERAAKGEGEICRERKPIHGAKRYQEGDATNSGSAGQALRQRGVQVHPICLIEKAIKTAMGLLIAKVPGLEILHLKQKNKKIRGKGGLPTD